MITIRNSNDRGTADFGWLKSKHSFSFGSYFDPKHVSFGPLRVINEDRVTPGAGFDTHGHRDMEILSYVLEGELEHKDNTGTGSVIKPGDIQRMSAGSGILHSEFNHSKESPVHFLQIWIQPDSAGIAPGYEQTHFASSEVRNQFNLVAGPQPSETAVKIHQDAKLYIGKLDQNVLATFNTDADRGVYVQVAKGSVVLNGQPLIVGDGARITDETNISVRAIEESEVLLFDLNLQNHR